MLTDEARLAKNKQTAETLKATRLKSQLPIATFGKVRAR